MTQISLEIVNFDKEMRRVEDEVKRLANLSIDDRIDMATNTLRLVTPVDTGKARRGWRNETSVDLDGYVSGAIINDVDYIDVLNKGHSRQAPRRFIEQVLITIGILTPN